MNTKKILLISTDKELSEVIKISALTLTKLNCQVEIDSAFDENEIKTKSGAENLDMIILDNEFDEMKTAAIIKNIRKDDFSKRKKIMVLYENPVINEIIFQAGCDSIMSKTEFRRAVNNILVF